MSLQRLPRLDGVAEVERLLVAVVPVVDAPADDAEGIAIDAILFRVNLLPVVVHVQKVRKDGERARKVRSAHAGASRLTMHLRLTRGERARLIRRRRQILAEANDWVAEDDHRRVVRARSVDVERFETHRVCDALVEIRVVV